MFGIGFSHFHINGTPQLQKNFPSRYSKYTMVGRVIRDAVIALQAHRRRIRRVWSAIAPLFVLRVFSARGPAVFDRRTAEVTPEEDAHVLRARITDLLGDFIRFEAGIS